MDTPPAAATGTDWFALALDICRKPQHFDAKLAGLTMHPDFDWESLQ